MPRYFFHVRDGKDLPDKEGVELSSHGEVRAQAIQTMGEMLRDAGDIFWNHGEWEMAVVEEGGRPVLNLRFMAESVAETR